MNFDLNYFRKIIFFGIDYRLEDLTSYFYHEFNIAVTQGLFPATFFLRMREVNQWIIDRITEWNKYLLITKQISRDIEETHINVPESEKNHAIFLLHTRLISKALDEVEKKHKSGAKKKEKPAASGKNKEPTFRTLILQRYYEKGCAALKSADIAAIADKSGKDKESLRQAYYTVIRQNHKHTGTATTIKAYHSSYIYLLKTFKKDSTPYKNVNNHLSQLLENYKDKLG